MNRHTYPLLSLVMLCYLQVPASSVPTERVFSAAGNVSSGPESLTPENGVFLYHDFTHYSNIDVTDEPQLPFLVGNGLMATYNATDNCRQCHNDALIWPIKF